MLLKTNYLNFKIDENGQNAAFFITGKEDKAVEGSDFFRLILDDGLRTEIPIVSSMQKGSVTEENGRLVMTYSNLVSEYGDVYDIAFTVVAQIVDGFIRFTPSLANNTKNTRINECMCPLADFTELFGAKEKDVIYMPNGLGERVENPWRFMKGLAQNWYYHDEREVFWHLHYPKATMSWYGVESDGRFLYVGRHDEKARACFLTVKQRIRSAQLNLMFGVNNMPMARPGESFEMSSTVIGILDGDWRSGADYYRAWAENTFYTVPEKEKWVKELTGWQRIIMRSQYGEDYYKASDLPKVYEEGAKRGVHTIFLFAWWKEGMDRNYPIYTEPYEGAWDELRDSIHKVQEMGGRIILECNCHFMDPHIDYYKKFGKEVAIVDINGNEYRQSFVYPGRGELRATYGAVQFPLCCTGSERWRNQVLSQLELLNSFDADCLFTDCYCVAPVQPCFNNKHDHGNRVDDEWTWKRDFFEKAAAYCKKEKKVLAGEIVCDVAAPYAQFIHGGLNNSNCDVNSRQFPALFRYTFPEVVTTARGIRDSEAQSRKNMKFSLVMGLRLDAELYVCRRDIGYDKGYSEMIAFHTEHLDKYGDFYYYGKFTVTDVRPIPNCIKRAEYLNPDGTKLLRVLYNSSNESQDYYGTALSPDEMRYDIFEL